MVDAPVLDEAPLEEEILPLELLAEESNLMGVVDENAIMLATRRAHEQYEIDEASRQDWVDAYDKGMEMALQKKKNKSYPFNGCSNVIFPLITTASIQFAARAYPGIFPGRDIVKAKIIGDDSGLVDPNQQAEGGGPVYAVPPGAKADRARNVSEFMSWQLLEEMESWETDTDQLLHNLPISGCAFRKLWWNNGPDSKYLSARDLVVNMDAKSLKKAPQVTEVFELYPFQMAERVMTGLYDADAVEALVPEGSTEPVELLEAHCRYDMDGDGYPEPYIITMTKNGGIPLRVVANFFPEDAVAFDQTGSPIEPRQYYIKYDFIPNPDGGFYGIGFGWLLGPLNSEVNTAINQLNDAAHWQNSKSGFIGKRLKLRAGDARFKPGEWKPVESFGETIKNELVPLDFGGPSPTTFQLLSLMISAAQDISSVKDVMMGETSTNLAPTTILTLVEQGSKQFVAIYKRIHRALKHEMRLLFQMDGENIESVYPKYQQILDRDFLSPEDFALDMDVMPITDPEMVTNGAAMAKAELIMSLADQGKLDPMEATKRVLAAANIDDPESLMPKEPQPDPETLIKMAKLENDKARIAIAAQKAQAEILEMETAAIENVANAESKEQGRQLELYMAQLGALKEMMNEFGNVSGMAGQPANAGGVQPAPQVPAVPGANGQGAAMGNGPQPVQPGGASRLPLGA